VPLLPLGHRRLLLQMPWSQRVTVAECLEARLLAVLLC
jgi:hypothetical protein